MIAQHLMSNLLGFACVVPLVVAASAASRPALRTTLALCLGYFLCYHAALLVPVNAWLGWSELQWNWGGKLLAIAVSVAWYRACKHRFAPADYVMRAGPAPKPHRRLGLVLVAVVAGLALLEGLAFYHQPWRTETLTFQATLPGIDEELAYRGILLGMLTMVMHPVLRLGRLALHHPAMWVVGLLFGLDHGLALDADWGLRFDTLHFLKTFVLGVLWGYLTLKTRSVWWAMVAHNLSNTLANLVGMLK